MEITRVDTYTDHRFSEKVLQQHGCFLAEGMPCEIEILSDFEAMVRCGEESVSSQLIEEFRFYTPHITRFYDTGGKLIREYPAASLFWLEVEQIQPSQFYVDQDKVAAIRHFIHEPKDIIIPVKHYKQRYISLDGHTRLSYAVQKGWNTVRAVEDEADLELLGFVEEAQRRGIYTPKDMELVSHGEYQVKWNRFCDEFFEKHGA